MDFIGLPSRRVNWYTVAGARQNSAGEWTYQLYEPRRDDEQNDERLYGDGEWVAEARLSPA